MSQSEYESNARERRRVCVNYVDSGGHCRYDCEDLHPVNVGKHISIRGRQLRNDVQDAQVYVCRAGDRCRKFAWGICPNSHARDARDSRAGSTGNGKADSASLVDEVASQPSSSDASHRGNQSSPSRAKKSKACANVSSQGNVRHGPPLGPPIQIITPWSNLVVPPFKRETYRDLLDRPEVLACWLQETKQRDITPDDIRDVQGSHRDIMLQAMKDAYRGWPLIFFAVHSSRPRILEFLLDCGTSPDIHSPTGIPLLAFVILCHETSCRELMTKTLLDYGANPRVVPLKALSEGHYKADNAPGWMKVRPNCASIFATFRVRLTPGISQELQIKRSNVKRPSDTVEPAAASRETPEALHLTSRRGGPLCDSPSSTAETRFGSPLDSSSQAIAISHGAKATVHRGASGPASVVLLSTGSGLPTTALGELSDALGAGIPLVLPARYLCNQYPELRRSFQRGENPQTMRWPIDDFIRQTEGRRGMILIDSIDQGLDSNSAAYEMMCQWWKRGVYESKFGSEHDIRNIIWVLTCPRYSNEPPISGLRNIRRSEALNPIWPLLAYELTWPNMLSGVEMASLIRTLANEAAKEKPNVDRPPSSRPPALPPLPSSPTISSTTTYNPSVSTVYPETVPTTPSLQEEPGLRRSMDTIDSVPETIATPPLINLLDDPLDIIEAESLRPPMQAIRLDESIFRHIPEKPNDPATLITEGFN